jgi:hypothetical protein
MSPFLSLEAHEWERFSVPHSVRLVGEEQHLLGAGSVSVATTLRVHVEVEETGGEFSLSFGGGPRDEDGRWQEVEEPLAEFAARWENAVHSVFADEPSAPEGLDIEVDFGPLWQVCPPGILTASPAVAVAMAVAVAAHRGEGRQVAETELAELACRLHYVAAGAGRSTEDRFYSDALLSIIGGAGYVEPHGERLNVQQLLPPEALLLVVMPGVEGAGAGHQLDEAVLRARAKAKEAGGDLTQPGDAGFSALFALADVALSREEVAMLYGLMRVRQMVEGFLEHLGEPHVDNDRLAGICDEESAILADYFGFPGAPYERVRAAAGKAGALGTKLTWAFGGYPAALVVAPGQRREAGEALTRTFPGLYCLLVDMDPAGLLRGEEEEAVLRDEF